MCLTLGSLSKLVCLSCQSPLSFAFLYPIPRMSISLPRTWLSCSPPRPLQFKALFEYEHSGRCQTLADSLLCKLLSFSLGRLLRLHWLDVGFILFVIVNAPWVQGRVGASCPPRLCLPCSIPTHHVGLVICDLDSSLFQNHRTITDWSGGGSSFCLQSKLLQRICDRGKFETNQSLSMTLAVFKMALNYFPSSQIYLCLLVLETGQILRIK